ncbi:Hpt domain-containing protein [Euryhalocaulis caribicus]|uniref:Hpt domain-containing protein n=1 Tax=Euryhalocaulis caribicus TaxID=1161401 RepID=UPI0003A5F41B|nr:Hpt domain-containing protein [Euryhalocaulis caribicus]
MGFDSKAIERAEAALNSMSGQFSEWLQQEITSLEACRQAARAEGLTGEAGEALYARAHDLKGLGTTYDFPIVTRMGASLSRLIETRELRNIVPLPLVEAHVDAIKAAVRDGVKDVDHPVGAALVAELESRVEAIFPSDAA